MSIAIFRWIYRCPAVVQTCQEIFRHYWSRSEYCTINPGYKVQLRTKRFCLPYIRCHSYPKKFALISTRKNVDHKKLYSIVSYTARARWGPPRNYSEIHFRGKRGWYLPSALLCGSLRLGAYPLLNSALLKSPLVTGALHWSCNEAAFRQPGRVHPRQDVTTGYHSWSVTVTESQQRRALTMTDGHSTNYLDYMYRVQAVPKKGNKCWSA